jgi:hypothetical protein
MYDMYYLCVVSTGDQQEFGDGAKVEHAGQIHVCEANAGGMLNLLNIGVAWMLE